MQLDENTLCWIAGLFEGEAHFGAGTPSEPNAPRIAIHMTDEDVISRVGGILGRGYTIVRPQKADWNTTYKVSIKGAPAVELMSLLRPIMGSRRKSQIDRATETYVHKPNTNITTPKLSEDQVREMKKRLATGETAKSIAQDFPISHYTVWGIRCGKTWKHVKITHQVEEDDVRSEPEASVLQLDTDEKCLYWLVGLLEGEGSFMRGAPSSPNVPRISVAMTDEDVIARVASICGSNYESLRSRNSRHKNVYRVLIRGRKAIELMRLLYPFMGKRRQLQINEVLHSYVEYLPQIGSRNPSAKLSEAEATEIKRRVTRGEKPKEIAEDFNISVSIVTDIKLGRTWKHIQI